MITNNFKQSDSKYRRDYKKTHFLAIILFFYLMIMFVEVSAINATSDNYTIAMFGSGLQSSNASSSSYNGTLLLTYTGSTRGANTTTYNANIGFFDNVSYFRAVSISSYSITPSSAVVGSTISLSISALNSQAVWANVTSPNNQVQRLNLINDDTVTFLPIPSVVGTYTVTFYANSSTGTIASAVDTFELTAESTTTSTGGGGGGGGTTIVECTYNWDCTPWSVCADGKQTRECKNIGSCTGIESKPIEEIACSQALFDILLKLKNINLTENNSLVFSYDLIEQIGIEKIDVHVKTSIIDSRNNEIFSRIETKAIQRNLSIEEEINEIRFVDDVYILRIDILYGNLQRAFAEQKFRVENGQIVEISKETPSINKVALIILIILILAIIIITRTIIVLAKRRKKKDKPGFFKTIKRYSNKIISLIIVLALGSLVIIETLSRPTITIAAIGVSLEDGSNIIFAILLIIILCSLFIFRKNLAELVATIKEKISLGFSNKVSDLIGKEVYTEAGDYIGEVEEVITIKNKIDSLKIKLSSKEGYKGVILKYGLVRAVKNVVIIQNFEINETTNNN